MWRFSVVNIKSYSGVVAGVVASTTVLVAPAQGASVQVQDLEVRPGNGKLELALAIAPDGSAESAPGRPQVSTTQKDRALITEITNAQLDLGDGQQMFTQENPLPGIERLEVMESSPGKVRIVALGEVAAPTGEILSQDTNRILLNVTAAAPTEIPQTETESSTVIAPTLLAQNAPSNSDPNNFLQPATPIPPFLPRASAPPVGDIAVSTIDTTLPSYVNLQTNAVVPRLVLKEAPIEDVMSLLARASNLNIIVGNDVKTVAEGQTPPTVTLDMENAPVQDVFNYVLMLGDLNAVRNGNTIFVGRNLPFAIAPRITRSFRLNQATPEEARCFLITGDSTVSETINEERTTETAESAFSLSEESGDAPTSRTQSTSVSREVTRTCAKTPTEEELARGLLSRFSGLDILTDARLKTITLGGDPKTIEVASNFLRQLDARQRQVAVNVKIIDVTLSGNRSISSDIKLLLEDRVGISAGNGIAISPQDITRLSSDLFGDAAGSNPFGEFSTSNFLIEQGSRIIDLGQALDPSDGPNTDTERTTKVEQVGNIIQATVEVFDNEGNFQRERIVTLGERLLPRGAGTNFIGGLVAGLLRNTTSKIIADPTLIIKENETGELRVTNQIINSVEIVSGNTDDNGNNTGSTVLPEPVLAEVGLFVPITVESIDDNGFVTLNITPEVSSPDQEVIFEAGDSRNVLTLKRQSILNSGSVRLRDDQTLILAGAIDERDITTTSKVPILGDIPILGALFRNTSRTNERRELLFIITPQVIDDSDGAMWGYGYQPSETAREMLDNARFPNR
ncbi:AMIN domain-containing protein [Synechococcus moorigangaii CMS01]|nr:AMIN domain-containing protein [Synechococcus moorigangaii CMS01]